MHSILKIYMPLVLITLMACTEKTTQTMFEGNSDIGAVGIKGGISFDEVTKSYAVIGGGTNMWNDADEFHFAWKKVSGDMYIEADIAFEGEGVDPHRKACLLFRESLEPDAAYVDAALHGDGLTSVQFREENGQATKEIRARVSAPAKLRLEKEGDYYYMSFAKEDGNWQNAGGSLRINLPDTFYIGIGVSAHNNEVSETAVFSNVVIDKFEGRVDSLKEVESTLEIIDVEYMLRRVVYHAKDHFEAPNWTPDGEDLIYNSKGLLYRIPVEGGAPEKINTGFANKINNDHGISPDGRTIVISDQTENGESIIYTLPMEGGDPIRITPNYPSYWHGWSPDGETLAYCAARNGNYDIYSIPVGGGEEARLTSAEGLDDGPDYSPDGQYIYFNSVRSGTMQIWRMKSDGSDQEQVTTDDLNDWFAHPSPDGKWIAYVTFGKDVPAGSHPPNKHVMLRLMNLETRDVTVMARLFGGQGTINVPSWSPDSKELAFVSYQLR